MSCEVGCPAVHKLVDDSKCKTCFYHPLPSDVSILRCRYPLYEVRIQNMYTVQRRLETRLKELIYQCDRLYAQGRQSTAAALQDEQQKIRIQKEKMERNMDLNKKMMREAFEINDPLITETEEYLSSLTRKNDIAEKLFLSNKNLYELYTMIREKAITTPESAIECALNYFGIKDMSDCE